MEPHENTSPSSRDISQEILNAVEELILGSGFGSIEIIVHDGKVTQIERKEKIRFNNKNHQPNPSVQTAEKSSTHHIK